MKCLQCDSERLVKDVRVVDQTDIGVKFDLKLEVERNPEAWIFKGVEEGVLKANVCAECGFVMLSVSPDDAKRLEEHQG